MQFITTLSIIAINQYKKNHQTLFIFDPLKSKRLNTNRPPTPYTGKWKRGIRELGKRE